MGISTLSYANDFLLHNTDFTMFSGSFSKVLNAYEIFLCHYIWQIGIIRIYVYKNGTVAVFPVLNPASLFYMFMSYDVKEEMSVEPISFHFLSFPVSHSYIAINLSLQQTRHLPGKVLHQRREKDLDR